MEIGMLLVKWAERGVLALLCILSVWSIAIILDRRKVIKNLNENTELEQLKTWISKSQTSEIEKWMNAHSGLRAGTLKAALAVQSKEAVEHAVRSYLLSEKAKLEEGFTTLATLGSNAPFIGLFGTVLGIIQAFGALAINQGQIQTVMGNVASALIATAIGIFVAIPALTFYNAFSRKLKVLFTDCESLKDHYISRMK